jgi:site-specific recombinase XerD
MITKSPLKYTKRDDQPIERSLLLFENSVKSKITFREYLKRLEKFREFCNADSFDSLSRMQPAKLQEMLEDYIMLRKKQINPNSIPVEFFAIKSFLEINEVELKLRKVSDMVF